MTFRTPLIASLLTVCVLAVSASEATAAPSTASSSKATRSVERSVNVYRGAKLARLDEPAPAAARVAASREVTIVTIRCGGRRYLRTHGFTSGLRVHHRSHGGFPGDQFGVF